MGFNAPSFYRRRHMIGLLSAGHTTLSRNILLHCNSDPCITIRHRWKAPTGVFSTKSSLLRGTMRLRKNVVPHFLALSDSTQDLVRALQALAAAGKPDEAEAI